MQQSDADLSTVWVQSKDTPEISSWLGDARQPVILEKFQEQRSQNSFSLVLETNRRSVLVLNEYFRSEWKVSVNGKNQKPFKVNLNQIAVLLPEGANQVRFEYRPSLFLFLVYVQKGLLGVIAAGLLAKAFRTVVSSRNGLSDVK